MNTFLRLLPWSVAGPLLTPILATPSGSFSLLGYVGPGAGLSMMGALLAVTCVILLALLAPLLYPIRLVRSLLRKRRERLAAIGIEGVVDDAISPAMNEPESCQAKSGKASNEPPSSTESLAGCVKPSHVPR